MKIIHKLFTFARIQMEVKLFLKFTHTIFHKTNTLIYKNEEINANMKEK